jgi:hypothetical protein
MQSSGQRPAVDNAVVAELGDMEQYVSDIEERLFDINVKLYQLKKERCEIKNYGYVGSYIRPVGI